MALPSCAQCVDEPGTIPVDRQTYKGNVRQVLVCRGCIDRGSPPASAAPPRPRPEAPTPRADAQDDDLQVLERLRARGWAS